LDTKALVTSVSARADRSFGIAARAAGRDTTERASDEQRRLARRGSGDGPVFGCWRGQGGHDLALWVSATLMQFSNRHSSRGWRW